MPTATGLAEGARLLGAGGRPGPRVGFPPGESRDRKPRFHPEALLLSGPTSHRSGPTRPPECGETPSREARETQGCEFPPHRPGPFSGSVASTGGRLVTEGAPRCDRGLVSSEAAYEVHVGGSWKTRTCPQTWPGPDSGLVEPVSQSLGSWSRRWAPGLSQGGGLSRPGGCAQGRCWPGAPCHVLLPGAFCYPKWGPCGRMLGSTQVSPAGGRDPLSSEAGAGRAPGGSPTLRWGAGCQGQRPEDQAADLRTPLTSPRPCKRRSGGSAKPLTLEGMAWVRGHRTWPPVGHSCSAHWPGLNPQLGQGSAQSGARWDARRPRAHPGQPQESGRLEPPVAQDVAVTDPAMSPAAAPVEGGEHRGQ